MGPVANCDQTAFLDCQLGTTFEPGEIGKYRVWDVRGAQDPLSASPSRIVRELRPLFAMNFCEQLI